MMPGFRHRNRPTKMHDKGKRCFYLNFGNDHSFENHKVITPAGIATYSAHCTFGYRRLAFQGDVPAWGGGVLLPLRGRGRLRRLHQERHRIRWQWRHLHAVGVLPPRHRRRQQLRVGGHSSHAFIGSGGGGGGIMDIFARGGCPFRVSIDTGTDGVGSSTWGGHSSHVFIGSGGYVGGCGDIFPRRGYSRRDSSGDYLGGCGDILPQWGYFRHGSSGGAYRWHTCKRERSRTATGSG